MGKLHVEEVPAAQVNSVDDVFGDPQVINNSIIHEWVHPDAGLIKMAKPPVRWGATEPEIKWSTDHLGQHTEEILAEYGFNDDDVKRLKVKGVIADQ
jgi:crotonobetainyl-CoA:carnitine CoA-transferase CaiB-like acyl-CoA transferase